MDTHRHTWARLFILLLNCSHSYLIAYVTTLKTIKKTFSHFADFEQAIIKISHFADFEQVIIKISHFADFSDFEQVIIKISHFAECEQPKNISKILLGETGCLSNPSFLFTGHSSIRFFKAPMLLTGRQTTPVVTRCFPPP